MNNSLKTSLQTLSTHLLSAAAIFDIYEIKELSKLSEDIRNYLSLNGSCVEKLRLSILEQNEGLNSIVLKLYVCEKNEIAIQIQEAIKNLNQECDYWLSPTQPIDVNELLG